MKAPDKIYLQVCGSCDIYADCKTCTWGEIRDNVTWSEDKIFDRDTEYIRKETVLDILKNSKHLADAASKIDEI